MTDLQTAYLAHYRRFKAMGLKPLTLSQVWDACFDPIVVPVFIKGENK